jgi:hypothetical protein
MGEVFNPAVVATSTPDSEMAYVAAPSEVIAIFPPRFSGSCTPNWTSRLSGVEISS